MDNIPQSTIALLYGGEFVTNQVREAFPIALGTQWFRDSVLPPKVHLQPSKKGANKMRLPIVAPVTVAGQPSDVRMAAPAAAPAAAPIDPAPMAETMAAPLAAPIEVLVHPPIDAAMAAAPMAAPIVPAPTAAPMAAPAAEAIEARVNLPLEQPVIDMFMAAPMAAPIDPAPIDLVPIYQAPMAPMAAPPAEPIEALGDPPNAQPVEPSVQPPMEPPSGPLFHSPIEPPMTPLVHPSANAASAGIERPQRLIQSDIQEDDNSWPPVEHAGDSINMPGQHAAHEEGYQYDTQDLAPGP